MGIRATCGNTERAQLEPLIPSARPGGRPRKTDMGAPMNAILYLLRTPCPWRYLPRDGLPPARRNAWQVDAAAAKVPLLRMEIGKRSDDMKGFAVLPRRWVVERTFS